MPSQTNRPSGTIKRGRDHRPKCENGRTYVDRQNLTVKRGGPSMDPRVSQTRQLVLAAARQLLVEEGQEAVTPTRLAEMTGISRSTIYRHWNDPLDIIFEATATDTDQTPLTPSGDVRADLRLYLCSLRDMLESPGGTLLATQIDRAEHNPTIDETLQNIASLRRSHIGDLVEHPGDTFDSAHALIVGPLIYQRFMTRAPITDDLIDLIVDAYFTTR